MADADTKFSIREDEPPKNTKMGYKVFVAKNGKLYPPMAMRGAETPVGVWLDAEVAPIKKNEDGTPALSKTGRTRMDIGGGQTLAFRPGWHLGDLPYAPQFYETDKATGERVQHPNFVWAECEYAADVDYQEEAMSYGKTASGNFQHSLAGLPKLPVNGYYKYRTNPNPDTIPWAISGAMKVKRV